MADKEVEVQRASDFPGDTGVPETEPGSAPSSAAVVAGGLRISVLHPTPPPPAAPSSPAPRLLSPSCRLSGPSTLQVFLCDSVSRNSLCGSSRFRIRPDPFLWLLGDSRVSVPALISDHHPIRPVSRPRQGSRSLSQASQSRPCRLQPSALCFPQKILPLPLSHFQEGFKLCQRLCSYCVLLLYPLVSYDSR